MSTAVNQQELYNNDNLCNFQGNTLATNKQYSEDITHATNSLAPRQWRHQL